MLIISSENDAVDGDVCDNGVGGTTSASGVNGDGIYAACSGQNSSGVQ